MPYQLHCWVAAQADADELDSARLLEERIDDDSALDDERLDDGAEDETTLELLVDTDEVLAPQIAPVTAGVSTAPLVAICNPNETVCPG